MNASTLPAAKHIDLSSRYGCAAFMTVVTFVACGLVHRARWFWRADMPTNKIELYTIASYPGADLTNSTELSWFDSAFNEDFLRYVDENNPSRVDSAALSAIAIAQGSTLYADQVARASLIELS